MNKTFEALEILRDAIDTIEEAQRWSERDASLTVNPVEAVTLHGRIETLKKARRSLTARANKVSVEKQVEQISNAVQFFEASQGLKATYEVT